MLMLNEERTIDMIKLYDYNTDKRGWETFPTLEEAVKSVHARFDDYWLHDKDSCAEFYIEIYDDNSGEYIVWCLEAGSWSYDESPYDNRYYGTRQEFAGSLKFTELHPNKDYILI